MYLNSSHCSTILGMEFYSTRRMPVRKLSSRPAITAPSGLLAIEGRRSSPFPDGGWSMGSLTEPLPLSLLFSSIVCLLARQPKPRDRSLSSAVCHAESPKYIRSHDFAENRLDPPQLNRLSSLSCSGVFFKCSCSSGPQS